MPQVGLRCVRGEMGHEECRRCAQDSLHPCGYTVDILEAFREQNSEEPGVEAFSPSRLLGCYRQAAYMQDVDYYTDVDSAWRMYRGTLIHAGMERGRYIGKDIIRELRMKTTIDTKYGPQMFQGKPDLIVVESQQEDPAEVHIKIVDYKTKEIDHDLVEASKEHNMQVLMYAWLASKALGRHFGRPYPSIILDEVEIVYVSLSKTRRFTSAGPLKAKGKYTRATKQYDILDLAPLRMLPMEQVERFIRARIESKMRALKGELPPVLGPDKANWCFNCPVRVPCFAQAEEQAA